ncbi:lipoma-preferred partner homolog, partial [Notechis scutatus]|uniref:Lipoma-preferred partner homolog n=1 Tax=Notechis scutatus TaxID=8663 RepID=A0A6J1W3N6_9SAUR
AVGIPGGSPGTTPAASTPVTGHKRMVIPNQPPLTATKKSATPKPIPVTPVGTLKPQPVAAPYATAATSTRPPFNVQAKSAHPASHFPPSAPQYGGGLAPQPAPPMGPYMPTPPRAPDYGYVPPPAMGYGSAPLPSAPQRSWEGAEPSYGPPGSTWKPEPAYPPAVGQYPSSGARKSHGYAPVPASQLPTLQPKVRTRERVEHGCKMGI